MSLTQVFQFMHEEKLSKCDLVRKLCRVSVLTLGCTSGWTQHSSISGSKMACVKIKGVFMPLLLL